MALFAGRDWDAVEQMTPPFLPQPDNDVDTSYFQGDIHFVADGEAFTLV